MPVNDTFSQYPRLHDTQVGWLSDPFEAPVVEATNRTTPAVSTDHLGRITETLRCGAQSLDCQAAVLYLIDSNTTQLQAYCTFGLSELNEVDRADAPATRPLAGAIGDLEALTGHVVALESRKLFEYWHAPFTQFGAAMCVPVASHSMPLGTVWFFSDSERPFSDDDTARAEVVAHRLAMELEQAQARTSSGRKSIEPPIPASSPCPKDEILRAWSYFTANTPPQLEGWRFASSIDVGSEGTAFRDWFAGKGECLNLMACHVSGERWESSTLAAGLHGAMHLSLRRGDPELALLRCSQYFHQIQPGDRRASALLADLHPDVGLLRWAHLGDANVFRMRDGRLEQLSKKRPHLGVRRRWSFSLEETLLESGDRLWIVCGPHLGEATDALHRVTNASKRPIDDDLDCVRRDFATIAGVARSAAWMAIRRS